MEYHYFVSKSSRAKKISILVCFLFLATFALLENNSRFVGYVGENNRGGISRKILSNDKNELSASGSLFGSGKFNNNENEIQRPDRDGDEEAAAIVREISLIEKSVKVDIVPLGPSVATKKVSALKVEGG